jgi:hypothetical protein
MSQFTTLLNRTTFTQKVVESHLHENDGSRLRGEWWLIGGGAEFADQEAGDMGHEGMAIQHVTNDLIDALGINGNGETVLLNEYKGEVEDVVQPREGETVVQALVRWLKENAGPEMESKAEEMVGIAWDAGGDAREYALENWGWQRVKGNTVETYTLTHDDMSNMASGLSDVLEEEGVDDDADPTFTLYVMSNQKYFTEVPYSVIQSGDVSKLREYDQSFRV